MFNNVAATRENSERILELLEKDRSGSEEPVGTAAKEETDQRRTVGDPPISAVISGGHRNVSASLSDGVIQLRVCRGRVLSE